MSIQVKHSEDTKKESNIIEETSRIGWNSGFE